VSGQNFSPLNLTGDEGRGFKQFPPFFEVASAKVDHSETMGWINLLHAPNYQAVAPIYRAKVYFFLFSPASVKSPSKVHLIFWHFLTSIRKILPENLKAPEILFLPSYVGYLSLHVTRGLIWWSAHGYQGHSPLIETRQLSILRAVIAAVFAVATMGGRVPAEVGVTCGCSLQPGAAVHMSTMSTLYGCVGQHSAITTCRHSASRFATSSLCF